MTSYAERGDARVLSLGGASVMTGSGMRNDLWNHVGGLHGEVQHASTQAELDELFDLPVAANIRLACGDVPFHRVPVICRRRSLNFSCDASVPS